VLNKKFEKCETCSKIKFTKGLKKVLIIHTRIYKLEGIPTLEENR
jgi:hypothetical protein